MIKEQKSFVYNFVIAITVLFILNIGVRYLCNLIEEIVFYSNLEISMDGYEIFIIFGLLAIFGVLISIVLNFFRNKIMMLFICI